MQKYRGRIQLVGFLLVGINLLALVLWLLGLELTWLRWMGSADSTIVIVTKLVLMLLGFAIIFVASTDFEGKDY